MKIKNEAIQRLVSLKVHILPIFLFLGITISLYYPQFFENKGLNQHDINMGFGASHQLTKYQQETGEEAIWMNNMFSGMPAYLSGLHFEGDLLPLIKGTLYGWFMPRPASIVFVCFIGFYLLLISFGVRPWIAMIGAIVFGLNGFNTIGVIAGHNAKIDAVSYVPFILAGMNYVFRNKLLVGSTIFSVALALHLKANHLQITYYVMVLCLIWGLVELIYAYRAGQINQFAKSGGLLIAAAILALGANFGRLWTVLEYSQYSIRGKSELGIKSEGATSGLSTDYAFQYSNGYFEPLVMFIPNILGGSSSEELDLNSNVASALGTAGLNGPRLNQQLKSVPTYWGRQPLTAPYYLGSAMLFLFVLGILTVAGRIVTWVLVSSIIAIILSWGGNFDLNYFLFDVIPGYNKFRSVTFWIIIPMIGITLIGFIGLEKFLSLDSAHQIKKLSKATISSLGFLVLTSIVSAFLSFEGLVDQQIGADWYVSALRSDRQDMYLRDIGRSAILTVVLFSILFAIVKNKISLRYTVLAISALLVLDSYSLTKRYFKTDLFVRRPVQTFFEPTESDIYIESKRRDGERVLNLINPFNESKTSYSHESVGGYHGAKLMRYQQLIERHLAPEHAALIEKLQSGNSNFRDLSVLNMLNTRFFTAGETQGSVIENKFTFGNAWIVSNVAMVESTDEEITALDEVDLYNTAVINQAEINSPFDGISNSSGNVILIKKLPNELTYRIEGVNNTSVAVFSEIYYPEGWGAYIDGQFTPILRANFVLRALVIPAGAKEIKFVFNPNSYRIGGNILMASNYLLMLLLLLAGYRSIRGKPMQDASL